MIRLVGLAALWLTLLVIAAAGGWSMLWLVVYLLAGLVVVSAAIAYVSVRGLELRRRPRPTRLQVGDRLTERVILEATSGPSRWWPRLWLELHDGSDLPGHHLDRVVSLSYPGRRVWELSSTCTRRGRFQLGPAWVASGDPFGLFRASRKVGDAQRVVVYPKTVDLTRVANLPGELPGGAIQGQRVQFSTPNVSSVREHAPGDSFNRIHWPTTARMGRLMVREFELDPSSDLWLVLDLDANVHAGRGDDTTEECAVTATASLARHFVETGRAVGLVSQNATLPVDRGPRQVERLLELLAIVRATSHIDLDMLLVSETSRFTRNSTLVIVTPSTSEQWVSGCRALAGRGVGAAAVLIEAATFGPARPPLLLVSSLAAAHVPTYLVKRGEALDRALSIPRRTVSEAGEFA